MHFELDIPRLYKRAIIFSVGIHLLFILALLIQALLSWLIKPKIEPHVFELVSDEAPSAVMSPRPQQTPSPKKFELKVPHIKQIKPAQADQFEPVKLPPVPIQETKPVEPEERYEKISINEFLKSHSPKPQKIKPRPSHASVNVDQIVQQINVDHVQVSQTTPSTSQSAQVTSETLAFQRRIRDLLNRTFGKPTQFDSDTLEATVIFTVYANGRLGKVRFSKRSGLAAFDQYVLRVFSRAQNRTPSPDGNSHDMRITFRMSR